MIFEDIFSYFGFVFYLIVFFLVIFYVKRVISKKGFNVLCMFILTFSMFYFVVPFFQTYFKYYRDNTSLFTQMLNQKSGDEIFLTLLICLTSLIVIVLSYHFKFNSKARIINRMNGLQVNVNQNILFKRVNNITDIILIFAVGSIILLINEVGSLQGYLSLGAQTRGLDKDPTEIIRSSYLQLVTLSTIILVTPYLYLYLLRIKKNRVLLIKFIISLLFSILFLLYNQGRAPLIIFFLPFLFSFSKRKKKGYWGLIILFIVGIYLLTYLDGLFKYLSYGYYEVDEQVNFITTFLGEFSYPFANFIMRNELVDFSGYRYMYDYIIWPLAMIPSMLLKPLGIKKELIVSVQTYNTDAYGYFLGVVPSGGIPVDILTFNYYQLGFISLIFMCFIIGRALRKLDIVFNYFKDNFAIKIVLYRISFSMINILNNADITAIVRNRLDVVVLLIILIYIYRSSKKLTSIKGD